MVMVTWGGSLLVRLYETQYPALEYCFIRYMEPSAFAATSSFKISRAVGAPLFRPVSLPIWHTPFLVRHRRSALIHSQ